MDEAAKPDGRLSVTIAGKTYTSDFFARFRVPAECRVGRVVFSPGTDRSMTREQYRRGLRIAKVEEQMRNYGKTIIDLNEAVESPALQRVIIDGIEHNGPAARRALSEYLRTPPKDKAKCTP